VRDQANVVNINLAGQTFTVDVQFEASWDSSELAQVLVDSRGLRKDLAHSVEEMKELEYVKWDKDKTNQERGELGVDAVDETARVEAFAAERTDQELGKPGIKDKTRHGTTSDDNNVQVHNLQLHNSRSLRPRTHQPRAWRTLYHSQKLVTQLHQCAHHSTRRSSPHG